MKIPDFRELDFVIAFSFFMTSGAYLYRLIAGYQSPEWIVFNIYGMVIFLITGLLYLKRHRAIYTPRIGEALVPFISALSPMFLMSTVLILGENMIIMALPLIASVLYIFGLLITVWSFLTLGKNFSILPAMRGIVTHGPYRYMRHPAYLGETLYLTGILFYSISLPAIIVFLFALSLLVLRIKIEENILLKSEKYRVYASQVKYRLIPGLW